MRKNGINRELLPVSGGVCAPAGFKANGVVCADGEQFALVLTDGRYPAAFAYSSRGVCSAPVSYNKKRLQSGYARAVVVNGGSANIDDFATPAIKKVTLAVSNAAKITESEIAVASTGVIGKTMRAENALPFIDELVKGASSNAEKSLQAAQMLTTESGVGSDLAFSFQLGDFTCKIGAIFKGNQRVCPNMATFLCFFTTDTNISSEMLRKALLSATSDAFNQLDIDGVSSPNDTVGIIASGKAGNYQINCADGEYEKFVYALRQVAMQVCLAVAGGENNRAFSCVVTGMQSKSVARLIAKSVVGANAIKRLLAQNDLQTDDVLCTACSVSEKVDLQKTTLVIRSTQGSLTLFENGERLDVAKAVKSRVISGENLTVSLDFCTGNYTATAIGRTSII
jgi:glutamate N-acetyltransferase/amino-acid N-acetyltransferase